MKMLVPVLTIVGLVAAADIPRMPNGKPNLRGVWDHPYVADMTQDRAVAQS
jgi:hypothetical protein